MTTPLRADDAWWDIVPPAAPAPGGEPATLLAMAAVLLVALAAVWLYLHTRAPARAQRSLRRLRRELAGGAVTPRTACVRVERCLRTALRARRLEAAGVAPAHRAHWQAFLGRLHGCCFAAEPPPIERVSALLAEAAQWLPGGGRRA